MKGNLFSKCNLFRVCNTCARIKWVDREQILRPPYTLLKSLDTPLITHVIFWPLLNMCTALFQDSKQTKATDYTPTSIKAENNSCDAQIIVDFLLCKMLLVMKILRLHGKGMF